MRIPTTSTNMVQALIAQGRADDEQRAYILFRWRHEWIVDLHVPGVTATIPHAQIFQPRPAHADHGE